VSRLRALEQYKELLQQEDADIDILQAALLIARHAYPDLDTDACLAELDRLAALVEQQLPPERYPMRVLQAINKVLYQQEGYRGNEHDYYNPDNSCLNKVLELKTGGAKSCS
jgi:regulator of sirC expression with transglutaminase-like and TPR domain